MRMRKSGRGNQILAAAVGAVGVMGVASATQAATMWYDGTPATNWNSATNWSEVATGTTPNPALPGTADTVIFNVDTVTAATSVRMNANQSVQGMVVRNSGGTILYADDGDNARTLNLGVGGLTIASGSKLQVLGSTSRGTPTIALADHQVWRNFNNDVVGGSHTFAIGNQADGRDADVDLKGKTLTIAGQGGVQLGYLSTRGRILSTGGGGNIALGANAVLRLYNSNTLNNTARIADSVGITSYGGKVDFSTSTVGSVNYSETVGTLTLAKGALNHVQFQAGASNSSTFTYGGLTRPTGSLGTVAFNPTGTNGLGDVTAYSRNKLVFSSMSDTGLIGGFATFNYDFAAYNSTRGIYIAPTTTLTAGETSPTQVRDNYGLSSISSNTTVGALKITWYGTDLKGKTLTIAQGGLVFGNYADYGDFSNGTLTAGTNGDSAPLFVRVTNRVGGLLYGVHAIRAAIANNTNGQPLDLVKSGSGRLELAGANTYTGSTVVNEDILSVNNAVATSLTATATAGTFTVTSGDTSGLAPGMLLSGAGFTLGSLGTFVKEVLSSTQFKTIGGSVNGSGTVNFSAVNGTIASSPTVEVLYGATLDVTYHRGSNWTLGSGQTLKGNGTVVAKDYGTTNRTIQIAGNGTVAPGSSTGTLTVNANIAFDNNSIFAVEAKNTLLAGDKWEAGYDQLVVNGTVDLGSNAVLSIDVLGTELVKDDLLFIINNDSNDTVSGKFRIGANVLDQNEQFTADGKTFKISYRGDFATNAFGEPSTAGNDVVLQVVPEPSSAIGLLGIGALAAVRRRRRS